MLRAVTLIFLGALAAGAASCDSAKAGDVGPAAVVSAEPVVYDFAIPDFSMLDQKGRKVSRADLTGKVLVVDFIFTTCPTVCPRLSERMSGVDKALSGEADVRMVSITVDPENDTPEKLAAYGARYGADPERWLFLTGEPDHVRDTVIRGFKMAVRKVSDANIDHAEKMVLVDRRMHVVGVFDADDEGLGKLTTRAKELARAKD
ncbi:MAG: SCO family protein [Polyangiaceae bacterium]|nr:SCO family protein [Polyangiaceae bacterium]